MKRWSNEFTAGLAAICAGVIVLSGILLAGTDHVDWEIPPGSAPQVAQASKTIMDPNWFTALVQTAPLEPSDDVWIWDYEEPQAQLTAFITPGERMSTVLEAVVNQEAPKLAKMKAYVSSMTFVIPGQAQLASPDKPCEYTHGAQQPLLLEAERQEADVAKANAAGTFKVPYHLVVCKMTPFTVENALEGDFDAMRVTIRYTADGALMEDRGITHRQQILANSIFGYHASDVIKRQVDGELLTLDQAGIRVSVSATSPGPYARLLSVRSLSGSGGSPERVNGSESMNEIMITWADTWVEPALSGARDGGLALFGFLLATWFRNRRHGFGGLALAASVAPGLVLILVALIPEISFNTALAGLAIAVAAFGVIAALIACMRRWRRKFSGIGEG